MTSEVGEKLDKGNLVHLILNGETEEEPDWRKENEKDEKSQHPGTTPI